VKHLNPFTDKDFRISGVGNRIKDPKCLVYLYPNIPKEEVFAKFWTTQGILGSNFFKT
jgi:signal transducer and activator of transcription 5B